MGGGLQMGSGTNRNVIGQQGLSPQIQSSGGGGFGQSNINNNSASSGNFGQVNGGMLGTFEPVGYKNNMGFQNNQG